MSCASGLLSPVLMFRPNCLSYARLRSEKGGLFTCPASGAPSRGADGRLPIRLRLHGIDPVRSRTTSRPPASVVLACPPAGATYAVLSPTVSPSRRRGCGGLGERGAAAPRPLAEPVSQA